MEFICVSTQPRTFNEYLLNLWPPEVNKHVVKAAHHENREMNWTQSAGDIRNYSICIGFLSHQGFPPLTWGQQTIVPEPIGITRLFIARASFTLKTKGEQGLSVFYETQRPCSSNSFTRCSETKDENVKKKRGREKISRVKSFWDTALCKKWLSVLSDWIFPPIKLLATVSWFICSSCLWCPDADWRKYLSCIRFKESLIDREEKLSSVLNKEKVWCTEVRLLTRWKRLVVFFLTF